MWINKKKKSRFFGWIVNNYKVINTTNAINKINNIIYIKKEGIIYEMDYWKKYNTWSFKQCN